MLLDCVIPMSIVIAQLECGYWQLTFSCLFKQGVLSLLVEGYNWEEIELSFKHDAVYTSSVSVHIYKSLSYKANSHKRISILYLSLIPTRRLLLGWCVIPRSLLVPSTALSLCENNGLRWLETVSSTFQDVDWSL